jgi:uncharacterized iron-regulated membrane protein
MKLSSALVRRSLDGHGWLGLLVSALMYVVCLSGTLAVIYPELERWEQPRVDETSAYDAAQLEPVFNAFLADPERLTPHMSLYLPTADFPRTRVANEEAAWLVDARGGLTREAHPFTHLLTQVHLYLTLPGGYGMILVSALGALLVALILSGLLAHPRLVRDAFVLRWGRGDRLENTDLHNRLSVWCSPFFLLIAVTGAWFGLVLPLVGGASALTGEPREAIIASVFGDDPAVEGAGSLQLVRALDTLRSVAPQARPISLTIHEADTPQRFAEISARHPRRLLWSENYRFDMAGNYLGKTGFSDGSPGKQVAYAMYRLHFGHFDGLSSKLLYLALGLALTVVSATGMNIWLARRGRHDALDLIWPGLVWGFPLALAICALAMPIVGVGASALWGLTAAALCLAVYCGDARRARGTLRIALALVLLSLVASHLLRFQAGAVSGAALGVNAALLVVGGLLAGLSWRARPQTSRERGSGGGAASVTRTRFRA